MFNNHHTFIIFIVVGFVSDLKNVRVRQVALGKVHVVVLTDKGFVYTFGYNGRGQCGRCFSTQGIFVRRSNLFYFILIYTHKYIL